MHQVDDEQRARSEQTAKWDVVGCVMMWWYIYRRIYFCFLIYRGLGGYLCSVNPIFSQHLFGFLKTDQTPQADAPNPFVSFLNTFFLCFKEKSISVCITVLYYIIILIVHFSKSMYKQFAENNTPSAHISKY